VKIPADYLQRTPLLNEAGFRLWKAILEDQHAPIWNHQVGDRIDSQDLGAVEAFRKRVLESGLGVPESTVDWVESMRTRNRAFEQLLPQGWRFLRWEELPTTSRDDFATRLEEFVPVDADLTELVVYDSSGTSGHAIRVPTHPSTLGMAHTLIERVFEAWGIEPDFRPDSMAALNVCAQEETYVFANTFSVWNQSGFAKINLREKDFSGGLESAAAFLERWPAQLITSDPLSLSELMRLGLPASARLILSTAVALSDEAASTYSAHFGCPVVDWYSTTETGPIAFHGPKGWEFVAPDLFVEVLDPLGFQVAPGIVGDIAVTGGRNPYLPLFRYRTGDRAVMRQDGKGFERLEGRQNVVFQARDGRHVNSVDVGRALRLVTILAQHQITQWSDLSLELVLRPLPGVALDRAAITRAMQEVLGDIPVSVVEDRDLGRDKKVEAYRVSSDEKE